MLENCLNKVRYEKRRRFSNFLENDGVYYEIYRITYKKGLFGIIREQEDRIYSEFVPAFTCSVTEHDAIENKLNSVYEVLVGTE